MKEDHLAAIDAYYSAMARKDTEEMGNYLHPDILCIGPLAVSRGKEQVLGGVRKLGKYYTKLTLRSKFGSGDQVVAVYDLDFPEPIGHLPVAALLDFKEGLILKLELIFDARSLESKKDEIFGEAAAQR